MKMFQVREKGKFGELMANVGLVAQGYGDMRRTGRGSDVSVRKLDVLGRPVGPRIEVEVKHGKHAKMSPLQKKRHKQLGPRRHKELRVGWD